MANIGMQIGQATDWTVVVKDTGGNIMTSDEYTLTATNSNPSIVVAQGNNIFRALSIGSSQVQFTATPTGGVAVVASADTLQVNPRVIGSITVSWSTPQ